MSDQIEVDFAAILGDQWQDAEWRLDNLYWIVDKAGQKVRFAMNESQREFVRNLWYRNIVLKSRQRGFSTLLQIMQLDQALFNANHSGVVISDTLPNAGKLFAKVEFAQAHLPDALKESLPLKSQTAKTGMEFEHGSSVHVSTSSRGGTVQFLHVSELGKIARKYPERAREIVTGAFESVPIEGCIVVESTAEGASGEFWEICSPAMKRMAAKEQETKLDWRLHFFPWYTDADCRLSGEDAAVVVIPEKFAKYFREIEAKLGITIDAQQRAWYVKKAETLGAKMKQEYPSTPEEAFEQAVEGAVYGEQMTRLRELGRITSVPLDRNYRVNTFWDLGKRDKTAIWFHQYAANQHRWVRYHEDSNKDLTHYWIDVLERFRAQHGFQWGKHYLPHDADTEILGATITTARKDLERLGMTDIVVVPRIPHLSDGINQVRRALNGNHWFDNEYCFDGVRCLDGYQFEWDDKGGQWSREPMHNWASHGADALRQFAQAWDTYGTASNDESMNRFKKRARSWR